MFDEPKNKLYFKFEKEICDMGSESDGENLYDLISWSENIKGRILANTIPRVNEIIQINGFYFEVLCIKYLLFVTNHETTVRLLLRQVNLNDPRTSW